MKRLFLIILLFLSAVGCYDSHKEPLQEEVAMQANCTMEQLRRMCFSGCYAVVTDIICMGRVTSSDKEGNFYRSLVVEDDSGGVEIKLGTYNIDSQYPIGLIVMLRLKGAAIMVEDGVVKVGLPPQSFDSAPRDMEAQSVIDAHLVRGTSIEEITPMVCDIASLDTSLCGRFVRVENLLHSPLDGYEEKEYYLFKESSDRTICLYISSYANFSDIDIPTSELSIQGVLYYENVGMGIGKQFVIKPRSKDDISTISGDM